MREFEQEPRDPEEMRRDGRLYLRLITAMIALICVLDLVVQVVEWGGVAPVVTWIIVSTLPATLVGLLFKGHPVRWWLFAAMFLTALHLFFFAGQRMVADNLAASWVSITQFVSALALIGGGIFLGGSEEIHLYLQSIARPPKD